MTTATLSTRTRGRPREFDRDVALDKALQVFSERGYHAASISELTEAMGLASGSVYKAFKDKRGIFLAAFDRYRTVRRGLLDARMAKVGTGREKIREVLAHYALSSHGASGRCGCLVVSSANDLALFDEEAAERVAAAFMANEKLIIDLLRLGQSDGSIAAEINVAATARTLLCVTKGMRVVGKTGRRKEDMVAVADTAMKLIT
ncbi:TetR family transcriptional regulator [Rhizobium sp. R72]|uniref:TetR/AcrR family transcriptional regulator n=1 Tax=unclassified Rhizobium TaxID=2613769 RepID=UPI000B52BCA2|nr:MULTISPECIES: TetR/AcrR family transcriptional regulator [unclassified Rhizobium]OWV91587.1 TetR family transcriptional regulator [Rhizobium sp. R693]OWW03381.1 TetR family transcriptional regulator [Rhizobium sp. R72]OWW03573.1 TetR family transcriptional regulator [Rhizobium sp. R711]